jgi:hypothetical protein
MRRARAGTIVSILFGACLLAASDADCKRKGEWPQEMRVVTSSAFGDLIRASAGHPALVVLFAGWCGECRVEIPALDRALVRFVGTDLNILALELDEDPPPFAPPSGGYAVLQPMRLEPDDREGLVATMDALGTHYHRSIPYVALFHRSGALVRDRWTEGRRVEDISQTLSSMFFRSGQP